MLKLSLAGGYPRWSECSRRPVSVSILCLRANAHGKQILLDISLVRPSRRPVLE